jgi:hypothetical protein
MHGNQDSTVLAPNARTGERQDHVDRPIPDMSYRGRHTVDQWLQGMRINTDRTNKVNVIPRPFHSWHLSCQGL